MHSANRLSENKVKPTKSEQVALCKQSEPSSFITDVSFSHLDSCSYLTQLLVPLVSDCSSVGQPEKSGGLKFSLMVGSSNGWPTCNWAVTRWCQMLTRHEGTKRLEPIVLFCTTPVREWALPPTDLWNTEITNVPVYTCEESIINQRINVTMLHQITWDNC